MIPLSLLPQLSPAAAKVYLVLVCAHRVSPQKHLPLITISLNDIAQLASLGISSCKQALNQLCALGLLHRLPRKYHAHNSYAFLRPNPDPSAATISRPDSQPADPLSAPESQPAGSHPPPNSQPASPLSAPESQPAGSHPPPNSQPAGPVTSEIPLPAPKTPMSRPAGSLLNKPPVPPHSPALDFADNPDPALLRRLCNPVSQEQKSQMLNILQLALAKTSLLHPPASSPHTSSLSHA